MRLPDKHASRFLLIGASLYESKDLSPLPEVETSVRDLKSQFTLKEGVIAPQNCKVTLNPRGPHDVGAALIEVAKEATDLLLVYYSGHGLIGRKHQLYLVMLHSRWDAPEFGSLEFDSVRGAVMDSNASTKVIILDCCFSGRGFGEPMHAGGGSLADELTTEGTYVLASSARDSVSIVVPGERYTAFSGRLLDALKGGIPGAEPLLSLDALYFYLRKRMKAQNLPEPVKRATGSAANIALGKNPAWVRTQLPRRHSGAPPEPSGRRDLAPESQEMLLRVYDSVRSGALRPILSELCIGANMRGATEKDLSVVAGVPSFLIAEVVSGLVERGVVLREGDGSVYRINPSGVHTIGIAITREKVHAILLSLAGEVRASVEAPLESPSPGRVLEAVRVALQDLRHAWPHYGVVGIGVTIPGARIDPLTGAVMEAREMQTAEAAWHAVPLESEIQGAIIDELDESLRVVVGEEGIGLGIRRYMESGRRTSAVVDIRNATIGVSLIVDGQPVYGVGHAAREAGHVIVDPHGLQCFSGLAHRGCLETLASPLGILYGLAIHTATAEDIAGGLAIASKLARQGDPSALAAFELAGASLGQHIGTLAALLDPESVAIYGPVELVANGECRSATVFRSALEAASARSSGGPAASELSSLEWFVRTHQDGPSAAAAFALFHWLQQPGLWQPSLVRRPGSV